MTDKKDKAKPVEPLREATKPEVGYDPKNIEELFSEEGVVAMRAVLLACRTGADIGFMQDEKWADYIYSIGMLFMLNYMLRAGKEGTFICSVSEALTDVALNADELVEIGNRAISEVMKLEALEEASESHIDYARKDN